MQVKQNKVKKSFQDDRLNEIKRHFLNNVNNSWYLQTKRVKNSSQFSTTFINQCQAYPKTPLISKMERFDTIVNDFYPITIAAKLSVLDVCGSCEFASVLKSCL